MSYDTNTVEALAKEACARWDENQQEFEDSDCSEAMHSAEAWENTYHWLLSKLEKN